MRPLSAMPSPSLKFLKTFQIAAKRQSFKMAAEELCLTASAVSHQIKTLEEQLGVALFDRGAHSLKLTEAGAQYLASLEGVFRQLDSATEQLQRRFLRSAVRLQVPPFFGSELLVPKLNQFSTVHPDVDLQISARLTQGLADDVEVAVVVGKGPWPDWYAVRLFPQVFIPACAPALLSRLPLQDVRDVFNQTLIVYDSRVNLWEQWAVAQGLANKHPKQVIRFDSMTAAVDAAQSGVGLVLVSVPLAGHRFTSGALIKALSAELTTDESYYVLTRPQDYARPAVQVLVQWLVQQLGDQTADRAN